MMCEAENDTCMKILITNTFSSEPHDIELTDGGLGSLETCSIQDKNGSCLLPSTYQTTVIRMWNSLHFAAKKCLCNNDIACRSPFVVVDWAIPMMYSISRLASKQSFPVPACVEQDEVVCPPMGMGAVTVSPYCSWNCLISAGLKYCSLVSKTLWVSVSEPLLLGIEYKEFKKCTFTSCEAVVVPRLFLIPLRPRTTLLGLTRLGGNCTVLNMWLACLCISSGRRHLRVSQRCRSIRGMQISGGAVLLMLLPVTPY